jgi:membrane protein YqaA with SNARE-associated domain
MHDIVVWIQTVLIPTLGPFGLFVVAFFDSSFLSVPEINDVLVVTSSAAHPSTSWLYVLAATSGSLAGCSALWYIGRRGGEALLVRKFGPDRVARTRAAFKKWDILALAIPAVLPPPMPFKIFVISSGVFGVPFRRFAATLIVARGLRYAFWGVMGVAYGEEALALLKEFDSWFAERATVIFSVTAVLALAGLAYYFLRRNAVRPPAAPLL